MTKTFTPLALAIASLSLIGTASAETQVQTEFAFDKNLSIAQNYEHIRSTADAACEAMHPEQTTSFAQAYTKAKRECRAELIEAAVQAFDNPYLTAQHEGREISVQRFASTTER